MATVEKFRITVYVTSYGNHYLFVSPSKFVSSCGCCRALRLVDLNNSLRGLSCLSRVFLLGIPSTVNHFTPKSGFIFLTQFHLLTRDTVAVKWLT